MHTTAPAPPAAESPCHQLRVVAFHAPGAAVVILDDHWRYTSASAEAAEFLGTTRDRLIGQVCWELYPECRDTPLASLMRDVMLSREAGEIRTPAHVRPGWDITACVVPLPDGGIRTTFRYVPRRGRKRRLICQAAIVALWWPAA